MNCNLISGSWESAFWISTSNSQSGCRGSRAFEWPSILRGVSKLGEGCERSMPFYVWRRLLLCVAIVPILGSCIKVNLATLLCMNKRNESKP
jgi:hypothetical protein